MTVWPGCRAAPPACALTSRHSTLASANVSSPLSASSIFLVALLPELLRLFLEDVFELLRGCLLLLHLPLVETSQPFPPLLLVEAESEARPPVAAILLLPFAAEARGAGFPLASEAS